MRVIADFFLKTLMRISFFKKFVIYWDSRINTKVAGVSDNISRLLTYPETRDVIWADNQVSLEHSKVAIVTVSGLFVKDKDPFRESKFDGDFSYRLIPRDIELSKLSAGKILHDHRFILTDPNIVFPIDRLKELKSEGLIQDVAQAHYSFLGYASDQAPLISGSAKEVARKLRYEGVDKAVVISASYLGQQTAVLVQRAIEHEEIPAVSLIYDEEVAKRLKPSRALILKKGSLCRLEEYLNKDAQKKLLISLLQQFDKRKRSGEWAAIE